MSDDEEDANPFLSGGNPFAQLLGGAGGSDAAENPLGGLMEGMGGLLGQMMTAGLNAQQGSNTDGTQPNPQSQQEMNDLMAQMMAAQAQNTDGTQPDAQAQAEALTKMFGQFGTGTQDIFANESEELSSESEEDEDEDPDDKAQKEEFAAAAAARRAVGKDQKQQKQQKGKAGPTSPATFNIDLYKEVADDFFKAPAEANMGDLVTDDSDSGPVPLMDDPSLKHAALWHGCYPLNLSAHLGQKTSKFLLSEIRHDDFLTDAVIHNLLINKEHIAVQTPIDLSGCPHLTDTGLMWLSRLIRASGYKEWLRVNVSGCSNVTERGLLCLGEEYAGELFVDAIGADIHYSSRVLGVMADLSGCPLLTDDTGPIRLNHDGKLLICRQDKHGPALLEILTKTLSTSAKDAETLKYFVNQSIGDLSICVSEVSFIHPALELMAADCQQVLLPYDKSAKLETTAKYMTDVISTILSKDVYYPLQMGTTKKSCAHWSAGATYGVTIDSNGKLVCNLHSSCSLYPSFVAEEPLGETRRCFSVRVHGEKEYAPVFLTMGVISSFLHHMDGDNKLRLHKEFSKQHTHTHTAHVSEGDCIEIVYDPDNSELTFSHYTSINKETVVTQKKISLAQGDFYPFLRFPAKDVRDVHIENYRTTGISHKGDERVRAERFPISRGDSLTYKIATVIEDYDTGIISYGEDVLPDSGPHMFLCRNPVTMCDAEQNFTLEAQADSSDMPDIKVGLIKQGYTFQPEKVNPLEDPYHTTATFYDFKTNRFTTPGKQPTSLDDNFTPRCIKAGQKIKLTIKNDFFSVRRAATGGDILDFRLHVNGVEIIKTTFQIDEAEIETFNTLVPFVALGEDSPSLKIDNYQDSRNIDILTSAKTATNEEFLFGEKTHKMCFDRKNRTIKAETSRGRGVEATFGDTSGHAWQSRTSLTKSHPYFEVIVTDDTERGPNCFSVGAAHDSFRLGDTIVAKPGNTGAAALVFYNSKMGTEVKNANNMILHPVGEGETIGCGFRMKGDEYASSGIPCRDRMITMYWTRAGKEIHNVEFKYLGGGLHPHIRIEDPGFSLIIKNYMYANQLTDVSDSETDHLLNGIPFVAVETGKDGKALDESDLKSSVISQLAKESDNLKLASEGLLKIKHEETTLSLHHQYANIVKKTENIDRFIKSVNARFSILRLDPTSESDKEKLLEVIQSNQRRFSARTPYRCQVSDPVNSFISAILLLKEKKLVSWESVAEISSTHSLSGRQTKAALSLMKSLGLIMIIGDREKRIITDPEWLMKVINQITCEGQETASSVKLASLCDTTPVWLDRGLLKLGWHQADKDTLFDLLNVLMDAHQLIFLQARRQNAGDTKYHLLHPANLRTSPTSVTKYLKPPGENLSQHQKTYLFPSAVHSSVMAAAVSMVTRFTDPRVLWEDGCVWFQGPVQMFLKRSDNCITLTATVYSGAVNEEEEDYQFTAGRHHRFTMYGAFNIFSDILDYTFLRLGCVFWTEENDLDKKPANMSICGTHTWESPPGGGGGGEDRPPIRVCSMCNRCSDRHLSCDQNALPAGWYRDCLCKSENVCCWECGLCKTCAKDLWGIRSYLRPASGSAMAKKSKLVLRDEATGYTRDFGTGITLNNISGCLMDPVLYSVASVTLIGSQKSEKLKHKTTICLLSECEKFLVHAFPGKPMLSVGTPQDVYHCTDRLELLDWVTQPELKLEHGDTVSLSISESKLEPMSNTVDLDLGGVHIYHILRKSSCVLWQEEGLLHYKKSKFKGSEVRPQTFRAAGMHDVAQLIGAYPILKKASFEIEIANSGESNAVAIGVGTRNYPENMQPGWAINSISYHADDGGLYHENGMMLKKGKPCKAGDRMKCSLIFMSKAVMVSFARNDEVQFTTDIKTPEDYKKDPWHPMIGLHSPGEVVRLMDKGVWSESPDSAKKIVTEDPEETWHKTSLIHISPPKRLLFPIGETQTPDNEPKHASVLLRTAHTKPVVFKVKVTNPKDYLVRPNKGLIHKEDGSVTIDVSLSSKSDQTQMVLSNDKLMIQWLEVPDDVTRSPIGKDADAIFRKLLDTGSPKNHKLLCGWQTGAPKSAKVNREPESLPSTDSGPPSQPSYCLSVKKNGTLISSCYIPKTGYRLHVERLDKVSSRPHLLSICSPLAATPAQGNCLLVGHVVEATVDIQDIKPHLEFDQLRHEGYATLECRVERIDPALYKPVFVSCLLPVGGSAAHPWRKLCSFNVRLSDIHAVGTSTSARYLMEELLFDKDFIEPSQVDGPKDSKFGKTLVNKTGIFIEDSVTQGIRVPKYILSKNSGSVDAITTPDTVLHDYQKSLEKFKPVSCSDLQWLWTRQEGNLQKEAKNLKNWQMHSSSEAYEWDKENIFVFMPKTFDSEMLKYPCLQELCDLSNLLVHQVCKMENSALDADHSYMPVVCHKMHFTNAAGHELPSGVKDEHTLGDLTAARAYCELATNKLRLPRYEKLLGDPAKLPARRELEELLHSLLSIYSSIGAMVLSRHGCQPLTHIPQSALTRQRADYCNPFYTEEEVNYSDPEQMFADPDRVLMAGCRAHLHAGTDKFNYETYAHHAEQVNMLCIRGDGELQQLTEQFTDTFVDLEQLEIIEAHELQKLPPLSGLENLKVLIISDTNISALPADVGDCPQLQVLSVEKSPIDVIPESISRCRDLQYLNLSNCNVPVTVDVTNLTSLTELSLNGCPLLSLPKGLSNLDMLKHLRLEGPVWFPQKHAAMHLSKQQFIDWNTEQACNNAVLGTEKLTEIWDACVSGSTPNKGEIAKLDAQVFNLVPRLGLDCVDDDASGGIPEEIFELSSLETLELSKQAITSIPDTIRQLYNLRSISLNDCPILTSLPGAMGQLPQLKALHVRHCPALKTPPSEVCARGTEAILAYLKRLVGGFTENWRTKLMLVGLGGAGKTSLLRALMSSSHKAKVLTGEDITDGIDIKPWRATHPGTGQKVEFSAWDFAGQTVYYNTHQFFLSKRAVYLLLWTTRLGYEHAGLEFWLSSIKCHAPDAPIFIIGTHCDQVAKYEIPQDALVQEYPQIKGFHFVSNTTGAGVHALEKAILDATMEESYMGEQIPKVYLHLEEKIVKERKEEKVSVIEWEKVKEFGMDVGIFDEKDIVRAVQFLHDLGTIQYFDNEFLRDHVVIEPQWIVDVMAKVVNVKDSPIVDGRFKHADIGKVWSNFEVKLHEWLLRLTEAFDLTFPLPEEPTNLVPCLLPPKEPKYDWPNLDADAGQRETLMLYKFAYLPAGLFNRTQVRLFQFSDGKVIWKQGSLLKKNGHVALVKQEGAQTLMVRVQGPRPENILYLIHEVLESLIAEFFHGVTYEYLIPCPDCLDKSGSSEPCLFEASLIRAAASFNAPFLQCRKSFHTVSMPILQAIMPPDASGEFDLHFAKSIRNLEELKSATSHDVFFCYCQNNVPTGEDGDKMVHPRQVYQDILGENYKCWYEDNMWDLGIQQLMMHLQDSKMIVVFISPEFAADERCRNLFLHAKEILGKPYVVVCLGGDLSWQATHLGFVIGAQEVFVNMRQIERYPHKIKEMKEQIKLKMNLLSQEKDYPTCFISYCWKNSADAVKKGTRTGPGALGWGDPRRVKGALQERGVSCWIDVEQAGKMGLYQDISEGIQHCDVVVACLSKQYAEAGNCMMELRYAVCTLNKPVVVVVVGTGDDWQWGEIAMLMNRGHVPQINLQEERGDALERVYHMVKDMIPEDRVKKPKQRPKQEAEIIETINVSQISFKEEFELAQRKFLRLMSQLADGMDTMPYPRLFVLDFLEVTTNQHIDKKGGEKTATFAESRPKSSRITSGDARKRGILRRNTKEVMFAEGESNETSYGLEDWIGQTRVVAKLLCEDEQGWHVEDNEGILLKPADGTFSSVEEMVKTAAPYLGRVYTLLRHSGITLNFAVSGDTGKSYQSYVENYALDGSSDSESELKDLVSAYCDLRSCIIQSDAARQRGELERCHQPTGTIRWLCPEHRKRNRVTVLRTDVAVTNFSTPLVTGWDQNFLKEITAASHLRDSLRAQRPKRPKPKQDDIEKSSETPAPALSEEAITRPSGETSEQKSEVKTRPTPAPRQSRLSSASRKDLGPNAAAKLRASGRVVQATSNWPNQPSSRACVIL